MHLLSRAMLIVGIFFPFVSSGLAATLITPADRVSLRLNVREEASSNSEIVGKLEKNETAKLLDESVPFWYKIQLANGVEGFVSKAWSVKVEGEAETDAARIRLGSWNIKKLGHGSSKNYTAVANVIDSNFDLMAVIEVMQKGGGHPGYDELMTKLGAGWKGLITDSPRPKTTSGNSEFYAIVYRTADVRPCTGWTALRYHVDNDGSSTGTGEDHFSREPAFGCFEAGFSSGTPGFDLVLAAYHATFDGVSTIKTEVANIDDVFVAMGNAVPGEKDLIIAGDFNLTPTQLADLTHAADRTLGIGSTLNSSGAITGNLYDHMLVDDQEATNEMLGNARVLDVRHVASTEQVFFSSVSDHLPIVVEVSVTGSDDD